MELPNAFIGRTDQPAEAEVSSVLGKSAASWKSFITWLAEEQGVADQEWKSISPKYGWSLRLSVKKRNIVHLSPCAGCFRVAFILGDRAVKAALSSSLPKNIADEIRTARRHAEGTGIRLVVKGAKNLPVIRQLALVKLAN